MVASKGGEAHIETKVCRNAWSGWEEVSQAGRVWTVFERGVGKGVRGWTAHILLCHQELGRGERWHILFHAGGSGDGVRGWW